MFIISEGIYNTSKEISLKVRYLKINCLKIREKNNKTGDKWRFMN